MGRSELKNRNARTPDYPPQFIAVMCTSLEFFGDSFIFTNAVGFSIRVQAKKFKLNGG